MDGKTVQRLLALNRQFYDEFADPFAESRGFEQPGLRRALDVLPATGRLLDVGCGNGRLAHVLESADRSIDYLGIDFERSPTGNCSPAGGLAALFTG